MAGPPGNPKGHAATAPPRSTCFDKVCLRNEELSGSPRQFSIALIGVLCPMAGRLQQAAEELSFRFFTPEEADRILVEGARRGRAGSHAAIERILKHELQLGRPDLWQRIRQLKNESLRTNRRRPIWSPEDEKILRNGYQNGWCGKREAVRELLKRHLDWRPHTIWKRAAKLGLVQKATTRRCERSGAAWSEEDYRVLLDLAGYKSAKVISKLLHRSEAAVRTRLTLLGKSSRTHLEGFSRFALARELHLSVNAIQRLIVEGLLEVRDPRITRNSLDRLRHSGRLEAIQQNGSRDAPCVHRESNSELGSPAPTSSAGAKSAALSISSVRRSRAKRVWAEVAESLQVPREDVEKLIAQGILKLYDSRITEKSFQNFCRRHGSLINSDFLSRETRDWLQSTMDFVPHAGEPTGLYLTPLRKHARVVRQCKECGRSIRGNVFFRHIKKCGRMKPESEARS